MFPTIKQYFEMGLYTEDDVESFLIAGMITQDEYNQIIPPVVDEPAGHEKDNGLLEVPTSDKDNGLLKVEKPKEENE